MGARPVALLNSLRFGRLENERVKYLFENVVAGIAGYGNCIGIPTVGGEVMFDESYEGNPLVNAMCVGLIDHDKIQRGVAKGVGNPVFYVGPATGRDGIHGATFASEELTEESEAKRPAVQVGDPFMEKLVMEACLELIDAGIVARHPGYGRGGLTCSSAEMASKAGNGMELYLDEVPQREEGMTPYEMMLSESQERMLFVVEPEHEEQAREIFDRWGCICAKVGKVTDDGRLQLFHKGEIVARHAGEGAGGRLPGVPQAVARCRNIIERTLRVDTTAYRGSDGSDRRAEEGARFADGGEQGMGVQPVRLHGADEHGRAARVPTRRSCRFRGTRKALAMTTDCNGRYVYLDPEVGGKIAVAEAARNIVCSGAEPLAITDNLNFGSPEKPEVFWQLEKAADGMAEACRVLDTPVIGGNVSLYNENAKGAIYPTPVVGMVGLVHDLDHITTQGVQGTRAT